MMNVRFFENALSFSDDQVFIFDNEGRFVYANPAGLALLDVTADDLIGNRWADIEAAEETRELFHAGVYAAYSFKKPIRGAIKVSADGARKFFEYTLNPIMGDRGGVESVIVISRDITSRRLAEEALRVNEYYNASLLRLYKSLGEAKTYADIVKALGPEILDLLGFRNVHIYLIRGDYDSLLMLDTGGTQEEAINYLIKMDARFRTKIGGEDFLILPIAGDPHLERLVRAQDVLVVEDIMADPLTSKEIGSAYGYQHTVVKVPLILAEKKLGFFAMTTIGDERVRIPNARQIDYLRTLANHVAVALDRVRFLTERREVERALARQTRALARSNKELEEFAYVAAHDLQEPLRMVTNYVQLLAKRYEGKLDKDADDFIDFAAEGATRMKLLIDDLLAYSRVAPREEVPTDCSAVFKQVLSDIKVLIEENGATVTGDPLPTVEGDPSQLRQLFQNLISNAVKFRREEPPRVHVSAEKREGEWLFSVKDNGIGIDPQYFDRIFVVFQRLHPRKKYPGSGIGLALCKKIVESRGGRIWVESERGAGSTFYFTLPQAGLSAGTGEAA